MTPPYSFAVLTTKAGEVLINLNQICLAEKQDSKVIITPLHGPMVTIHGVTDEGWVNFRTFECKIQRASHSLSILEGTLEIERP